MGELSNLYTLRPEDLEKAIPADLPTWETAHLGWWDFQKRRWATLWLMRSLYQQLTTCSSEAQALEPGPEQDKLWHECYKTVAKTLKEHAEEAKGCFIKAGQVMSTMVGLLPDEVTSEMTSLTDRLPVSKPEEVFRIIREDLKYAPSDIFSSFGLRPVASASVAQVHKAILKSTGVVVAVKVQHEGVDNLLMEDVSTLNTVASQVAYWCPDLDFREIIDEMEKALPYELDFREERRALNKAGQVLRSEGSSCIIPRVHREYWGRRVFVMEYIDAQPILKLLEPQFLRDFQVDKMEVVRSLVDAFGLMAFKVGLYHADPHSGNVRLVLDPSAPGGARPVIFDWGQFKECEDEERLTTAKVIHCLANFDITGVFEALSVLGFTFKADVLNEDMRRELFERARGVMKDTVNKAVVRENVQHDLNEHKERVQRASLEGDKTKASRSPIWFLEELPRCVMGFLRMLQILRGLCVALDAEGLPILNILAKRAEEALQQASLDPELTSKLKIFGAHHTRRLPSAPILRYSPSSPLESLVQNAVSRLSADRRAVGVQIAVMLGTQLVCDVTAGTLSNSDLRSCTGETRFRLLDLSAGLGAIALLRCLRRLHAKQDPLFAGVDKPEDLLRLPVGHFWPDFGGAPEVSPALGQILTHSAGLQDAFPSKFSSSHLDKCADVWDHFEKVSLVPGDCRYAYLLQVFVIAKLCSIVSGIHSFHQFLVAELSPLGLDLSLPTGRGGEAFVCRPMDILSRVSMTEVQASRERRREQNANSSEGPQHQSLLQAALKDPLAFDPLLGNVSADDDAAFRAGMSLTASAKGLAALFSHPELHEELSALRALSPSEAKDSTPLGWFLTAGATSFTTGGLQRFPLRRRCLALAKCSRGCRREGWGFTSGLGPAVFHFPHAAPEGLTIAITVNNVLSGQGAVRELVTLILAHFGWKPTWTSMPVRTMLDAKQMLDQPELQSVVAAAGGIEVIRSMISGEPKEKPEDPQRRSCCSCCSCCACRCCCGGCRLRCCQAGCFPCGAGLRESAADVKKSNGTTCFGRLAPNWPTKLA